MGLLSNDQSDSYGRYVGSPQATTLPGYFQFRALDIGAAKDERQVDDVRVFFDGQRYGTTCCGFIAQRAAPMDGLRWAQVPTLL